MNETLHHQLQHRSIRFFQDRALDPTHLAALMDVYQRTASSTGMQMSSLIRVTDPQKKEAIAAVCGQSYISDAPELFIFLVDVYRNQQIALAQQSGDLNIGNMEQFFQGAADAYLSAQNMTNTIESIGLGACYLGSILNDPAAIIRTLDLPKLTFPILGLIFGYPADNPELKPRMSLDLRVGENSYPYCNNLIDQLQDYDQTMKNYYDTRSKNQRSDRFTDQVVKKFATTQEKRKRILRYIQDQGFDLYL